MPDDCICSCFDADEETAFFGCEDGLIRVVDVEDQDPEFIAFPSITRVSEDTQPGTIIMKGKSLMSDTYRLVRTGGT